MATVVITFFLFIRFYVYKMDADCLDIQRDRVLSRREKRWSMNSQRLEEIVAELMKPISDVRRSFDTDLSALLEEYLTEAGLHALEAGVEDDVPTAPNFAELALLLQHSASVYGRKVDFLYQHVLSVSDSLQNSTQELERESGEASASALEGGAAAGRRRRRASAAAGFEPLELVPSAAAAREPAAARPPPTLPRVYIELEPRQMAPGDTPLTDYDGEPVGLLADFHVAWRLQDGMLVDELEGWGARDGGALRPIPLMELQAAIEAAAPPPSPPASPPPSPLPLASPSPPSPPASPAAPLHTSTPLPVKKERKRKTDYSTDDMVGGCYRIVMSEELRRKLRKLEEFSLDGAWVAGVVASRRDHIRASRRLLHDHAEDKQGFAGWSAAEAASATAANATTTPAAPDESDDDGFFERSSLGDSDASRVEEGAEAAGWAAGVAARAAAGEARGLDVAALAGRVLRALPPPRHHSCDDMFRAAAADAADVPGLFLATLFLANAGNVELSPGAPLSLNSFSARLLSADPRLYSAAAQDDPHFLR